ncbi:MAG: tRNA pseudouridine(38-40) synthase TruA [Bacilli bacterium]|nr:tRNA pseudouridine(38-40) synthase TruA [Bacilli bacterium]
MRYLLTISYDGTNYCGYQAQPNFPTIQETLEMAIKKVNNNKKRILQSSGRTDKKVHALGQCAHVDLDIDITSKKLKRALNSNLPNDIHIVKVEKVSNEFHARYSAKSKEYRYFINLGEYNPIERNYVFQYNYKLDIKKMKKAIKIFLGVHDFRAFVTENKDKKNCVRKITRASIKKVSKDKYVFIFKGNGFLRYQIRNMVGILIKLGEGKIDRKELKEILESKNREKTGVTAKAEGLYLVRVEYK